MFAAAFWPFIPEDRIRRWNQCSRGELPMVRIVDEWWRGSGKFSCSPYLSGGYKYGYRVTKV